MITCKGVALVFVYMTCSAPPAPPPTDTFCTNYAPVYWHSKDTRKTKEQTDINNRKWKRLCQKR